MTVEKKSGSPIVASFIAALFFLFPLLSPGAPSSAEQAKLDTLAAEIDGAVVYQRNGRIYKLVIGDWNPIELGSGMYARWGPGGKKIAVLETNGDVYVMNSDGSNRTKLAAGGATGNCPLEFHTNGHEVIWLSGNQLKATDITTKATRSLMSNPPRGCTGEPGISADGKRLACRDSHDLLGFDLPTQKVRQYASGCSPGVSPNGARVMNNVTGHTTLEVRNWDGSILKTLHASNGASPDNTWDNHHWSNHDDYIAAKGDGSAKEVYIIKISSDKTTRVTWVGGVDYPDLYVGAMEAPTPAIGLDPTELSFAAQVGSSAALEKTVTVTNVGGGTLENVSVSENASWLTVSRSGSGNTQTLVNKVDPSGLSAKTYSTTVTVSGGGAAVSESYTVLLTITTTAQPAIALNPNTLSFSMVEGGVVPQEQVITVENSKTGTLNNIAADITYSGNTNGWLQIAAGGTGNQQTVSVNIKRADLPKGTYSASVEVSSSNAENSPRTFGVTLEVKPQRTITVTSPAEGTVWMSGAQVQITWSTLDVNDCVIRLSTDGGKTWSFITQGVDNTSKDWQNFPYTVPDTPSTECIIRVEEYNNDKLFSDSAKFTIKSGSSGQTLSILSPTAGAELIAGSDTTITWDSSGIGEAVVEYSPDNGESWQQIAVVKAADVTWQKLPWKVPMVATKFAQVRIRTPDGQTAAVSGAFTIKPDDGAGSDSEITLTEIAFKGHIPDAGAHVSVVKVDGQSFSVQSDGSFEATVSVPAGIASVVVEMEGMDGDTVYHRLMTIELSDAGPPIPELGVAASEIKSFLGGRGGVLVWVDASSGQLKMLDFREKTPTVKTLDESSGCVNPIISPDGTRVVYSRGKIGSAMDILIRNLAGGEAKKIGTGDVGFWYQNDGEEAIIYCDISAKSENGADGKTYKQSIEKGGLNPQGTPQAICDRAMDAGPNGDLTWLGQVYRDLWAYNVFNKKEYPTNKFFLMDGSPADHQTCNGSMAPDGSAKLMTLAIPHDYIRVFTFQEEKDHFEETSRINLPAGMQEWEYPEWSTSAHFLTAVLRTADQRSRLFIVKLAPGDIIPEALEITDDKGDVTFSHLFVE